MTSWLRQHGYALRITLRRLRAQPFSSLANLLVMALVLSLPVVGGSVLVSVQPLAREVSVTPELTLFMTLDATDAASGVDNAAAHSVARRIRAEYPQEIAAVRVVTRQDALTELRRNRDWEAALAVLPENPLPDAVVVTLAPGEDSAARATALVAAWQPWPEVERVQLDGTWVQRLEALVRVARIALGLLAASVALVVLAAVFNTVRMQALSQREEIAVARLVGATEAFVRRPFLYLGALTGTVSALLAVVAAALALGPLNHAIATLATSYGTEFALHLPDAGTLMLGVVAVAALGAASALWSVTRNTRF